MKMLLEFVPKGPMDSKSALVYCFNQQWLKIYETVWHHEASMT